jgi:hypothetical protein
MNLIPNAGGTVLKSLAVWGAILASVVTLLINGLNTPNAPDWVAHLHPADLKQTWDWLQLAVTPALVAIGRAIQQNSISNT